MKYLHIIKSPSYDSDGRLQKWLKQIKINNDNSHVLIVEDANVAYDKEINEAKISSKKLFFRKFFKKRKGYPFKILEYFFIFKNEIEKREFDVIVFHDVQQYLNLFYFLLFKNKKKSKKVVWDLHELPHEIFLNYNITRLFLKYLLNNVDIVLYTNEERRNYIHQKLNEIKEKDFYILNNFPEISFINNSKNKLKYNLFNNANPYIIWLGEASDRRNFNKFFNVYKLFKNQLNIVILGKVESKYLEEINLLKVEGVLHNNFVKQKEIINYIDNSFFSVVLYDKKSPNNLYCEPNRLYQLITRNIPVIVGNNPVMKNIVTKYDLGIVLNDEGNDFESLYKAFNNILKDRDYYIGKSVLIKFENLFSWENQFKLLIKKIQQ